MSPGFHADFLPINLRKTIGVISLVFHTCSGLVFLGRFWGPKYRTSAGVWMSRVYIYIHCVPMRSLIFTYDFFMTTPHHPDQNQPCKTKQNTLLSSAIHRNPTDVSSQFAMILILPWFCKPKAMIVHQKKTGRFPLSLKLHLFVKFVWSQDTKLTQAVS